VGDPSSDFQVEEQWDQGDEGRGWVYAAYDQHRPLDAAHPLRCAIYKMLRHFDSAVESKDAPDDMQYQSEYDTAIRAIEAALSVLR
jgi:hypothetical protein